VVASWVGTFDFLEFLIVKKYWKFKIWHVGHLNCFFCHNFKPCFLYKTWFSTKTWSFYRTFLTFLRDLKKLLGFLQELKKIENGKKFAGFSTRTKNCEKGKNSARISTRPIIFWSGKKFWSHFYKTGKCFCQKLLKLQLTSKKQLGIRFLGNSFSKKK
jgi:hypothetical protein